MLEHVLYITLLNLLLYFKTLRLGYVSDDLPELKSKSWDKTRYKFLFGSTEKKDVDHLKSLLIHLFASVSVYFALGRGDIGFIAAMLFSANPANNQCSVWLSGRHYAFCALCLMLCLLFPYLSPLFILIASANPMAYIAPIGFLLLNPYLVLLTPFIFLVRKKRFITELKDRAPRELAAYDKKFTLDKLIIAIKIYGFYFLLAVIPWKITFYHSFMHSGGGAGNRLMRARALKKDIIFWFGLALGVFSFYSIINGLAWSWGLFWYAVCISPYLHFFRVQQEIAERYIYIANIGVMFFLAHIIPYPAFLFLLGFYVCRTYFYYTKAYVDDYWLVETAVSESPGSWYAWLVRAKKRVVQKAYREALNMLAFARMLSPLEFKILVNLGIILKALKQHDEAEKWFKRAEENIIKGHEEVAMSILKKARKGEQPLV